MGIEFEIYKMKKSGDLFHNKVNILNASELCLKNG